MAVAKKSVSDLSDAELKGKNVLIRCDLNVPLDGKTITDDTRIRASVATIKHLVSKGARVAVTSHLGRPKSGPEDKFSLGPAAVRLTELLGQEVKMQKDCIGDEVAANVKAMKDGDVILLENSRFYKEEEKNDSDFAKKMAAPFDVFVNDAFGTAHRAHASTQGVTAFLKTSVAGFLLQKELDYLGGAVDEPKRPFAAIVGGSKVSSKIGVIDSLMGKCDKIIIGGGMVFTFLKARGLNVGSSLVEEDKVELARELEAKAKAKGVKFILPTDVILADKFAADAKTQVTTVEKIPDGWMGLDNGPESTKMIQGELADCKTIIWNGPMGVFEMEAFAKGTNDVALTLAECTKKGAITIIGGGDSVAAVEKAGLADQMSHISTGGGASLELLEGQVLPGVAALNDK
ncbi:phosphoglycerate kinase [Baffinella frigidus]|nr:phosphoglycerate kinase [Cryptophyta sp. CCMP2293]